MRFASVIAGAEKVWRKGQRRGRAKSPKMKNEAWQQVVDALSSAWLSTAANLTIPSSHSHPQNRMQQAPMSKMEPTEYLNDRYTAMEERLAVS